MWGGSQLKLGSAWLIALAAVVALMGLPAAQATAAPDPCAAADSLFDGGHVSAARAEYEQLGPAGTCATSGLTGIRELVRLCDLGHADLSDHRRADALEAYKSALTKNPKAQCAVAGVSSAGPDWLTRALDWVSTAITNLPTVLAGLGLLLLALFLLVVILGSFSVGGKYLKIERVPGLRTLLRPRIALGTISDEGVQWGTEGGQQWKVGASMTAQIKARLQDFREEALSDESPDDDLDFGSTNDAIADFVSSDTGLQTALGKVGELSESTKIVAAIIQLFYAVLPIRRLSVSGVLDPPKLQPPEQSSASTTLSMESGSRLVAAATLRTPLAEQGKPTSGDYMRLVDQVAVWVQFEVTKALTTGKVALEAPDSYARVREGLDRHFAGEAVESRAAFEEALSLSPRNWTAAIDLATTEARLAGNYRRAIQVLVRASNDAKRSPIPAGQGE